MHWLDKKISEFEFLTHHIESVLDECINICVKNVCSEIDINKIIKELDEASEEAYKHRSIDSSYYNGKSDAFLDAIEIVKEARNSEIQK